MTLITVTDIQISHWSDFWLLCFLTLVTITDIHISHWLIRFMTVLFMRQSPLLTYTYVELYIKVLNIQSSKIDIHRIDEKKFIASKVRKVVNVFFIYYPHRIVYAHSLQPKKIGESHIELYNRVIFHLCRRWHQYVAASLISDFLAINKIIRCIR